MLAGGVYLVGWVTVVPRFDAWQNARARRAQLEVELPVLRQSAKRVGRVSPQPSSGQAADRIQSALRESGLIMVRLDPQKKSNGESSVYVLSFTGTTEQFVKFLEVSRRSRPRLLITAVQVRSRDIGITGVCDVELWPPERVKSAGAVAIGGRDPFHPPPPIIPKMMTSAPPPPPPPPPEPVFTLKLMGLKDVVEGGKTRHEALVKSAVNGMERGTSDWIQPSSFSEGGISLEFDAAKGLVRIMRAGTLVKEWRIGESVNKKILGPGDPRAGLGLESPPPY